MACGDKTLAELRIRNRNRDYAKATGLLRAGMATDAQKAIVREHIADCRTAGMLDQVPQDIVELVGERR